MILVNPQLLITTKCHLKFANNHRKSTCGGKHSTPSRELFFSMASLIIDLMRPQKIIILMVKTYQRKLLGMVPLY